MKINKNNYEAFFLDYHEGTLTPQQVADLLLFVEQHPELKEEFESFENLSLEDLETISFDGKSSLKKEITSENREEYFIRAVENTLTGTEKDLVDTFIKQHPQFLPEFELFQKTKITAEATIVFENKDALKKTVVTADDLLIASVEGLLTKQEAVFLNQQLAVDAEMQNSFSLYKQTKLSADLSIIYEDKEELKRRERKAIPFFYYVAAAASIALLIGLFFIYNNGKTSEPAFADKTKGNKKAPFENKTNNQQIQTAPEFVKESDASNPTAVVVKNRKTNTTPENKTEDTPLILIEKPESAFAENKTKNKTGDPVNEAIVKIEGHKVNKEELPALAGIDTKQAPAVYQSMAPSEFLSLKQIMAEKIKEKTLDEETLAMQKKNGRSKRFSGWDLAQIVTKGISKMTGRDVEVKPTYDDNGDVKAYALGNGVQISKGK